jgi:hypothetical protein
VYKCVFPSSKSRNKWIGTMEFLIQLSGLRVGWHKLMASASDGLLAFNALGLLHCLSTIADAIDVALKSSMFNAHLVF